MSLRAGLLAALILCASGSPLLASGYSDDDVAELVSRISNGELPVNDRDRALSSLSKTDFDRAVALAPRLLQDTHALLRFRAAWILAEEGHEDGLVALRKMVNDNDTEVFTLAAIALGRLRDGESHGILSSRLLSELRKAASERSRPVLSALTGALADYGDPTDSAIIAEVIRLEPASSPDWLSTEQLGRTGGRSAVGLLGEIFNGKGHGWSVIAAGLGLARCGDAGGVAYIKTRLADIGCCRVPGGTPVDAHTDNPYGPGATSFILDRLGMASDEVLEPSLIGIIKSNEFSERAKSQAWLALSRIEAATAKKEIVELACAHATYGGAARLLALNGKHECGNRDLGERDLAALRANAAAPGRERRRWREIGGYAF